MDFEYSERVQSLVREIQQFVKESIMPLEPQYLVKGFKALEPQLNALRDEVKSQGWWLPHLPQTHGGLGLSLLEYGPISEALGQSALGHYVFNCQAPDAGNMEILIEHGTEAQKQTYLEPLLRGEIRSCFAMTEPDHPGSNPVWMGTQAIADGDDWVITGRKWFTTAADGANFTIVMAVTDADGPVYKRASQIIVPLDTPGYEMVRNISVMGEPGDGYASHAEVTFDNCRVPQTNTLGGEGMGFVIAQNRLGPGRIHHCMRWIGICERAFELMCQRAIHREIKPGQPLGHTQIARVWIAESRAEINAARLMVLKAAWRIDREGTYAAKDDISLIKFYVAGVLQRVLDRAIQLHGALGMTDDTPLAYWYRHERAARIYDGADEVHKLSVAKSLLKKQAEVSK